MYKTVHEGLMGFLISQTSAGSQNYKTAVRAASAAHVALTGVEPLILGGVALNNKDRVLLKDQSPSTQNGIYVYTVEGGAYTLSRSADANTDKEVVPNMIVPVSEGTFADTAFQLVTNGPIVLGTTALTFGFLVEQYTDQDAIDAVLNNVELADFSDFYDTGIRTSAVYVNDNQLDIQTAVDAVGAQQGKAIYLSPGSYGGATVTVTDKINLRIIGPATISGAHQCELAGGRAMTISGATSTRIGLMNFEIEGGLTITGTQGRHYLRDMILGGLTISGSTANFLVFQNCSFTGSVSVNVPLGTMVYFIQCDFGNQTITNTSAVPQQVVFNNCAGFNSLPTGTLLGQSVLAAGTSQVNSDKILVANGNTSLPSYSFNSDNSIGLYKANLGNLGLAGSIISSKSDVYNFGSGAPGSSVTVDFSGAGNEVFFKNGGLPGFSYNYRFLTVTNDLIAGSFQNPEGYSLLGLVNEYYGHAVYRNRFFTGSFRYQLSVGKSSQIQCEDGGVLSTRRPDDFPLYLSMQPNGTNTVPYIVLDRNGRIQSEIVAGPGNYLKFSATGNPDIICKLTGVGNDTFIVDKPISTAYTGITATVLPANVVIRNNNGNEVFEIDYKGDTKLNGSISLKSLHAQSATVTVSVSDCYIGCNAGAVVNLPSAALCKPGQQIIIKDESGAATSNNISINANGSDLIDGNASESLVVNYESLTLICNGVNKWFII